MGFCWASVLQGSAVEKANCFQDGEDTTLVLPLSCSFHNNSLTNLNSSAASLFCPRKVFSIYFGKCLVLFHPHDDS